jgi:pyridoxine 4-dehydrogenase
MAITNSGIPETFNLGGDLSVRRLGFGAMRLTGPGVWGWHKDISEARRVLRRVIDLGINSIDTQPPPTVPKLPNFS